MLCYVNLCYEMLYSMCFWDLFTFYTPNIHVKICIKKGKGFKSEGFQVRFSFLREDFFTFCWLAGVLLCTVNVHFFLIQKHRQMIEGDNALSFSFS